MNTIKEHDVVRLKVDTSKTVVFGAVHNGDEGTVVHIYHGEDGKELGVYEVEFPALRGNTMTLLASMIEPV